MNFEDLDAERKAQFNNVKTPEEFLALVEEEGVELSDDELESISGGWNAMACASHMVS